MSGKTKGIILAITAATMWGIMGIFVRGLQAAGYTVATIGFVRCLVAAVTLLALTLILNPSSLKISMRGFFLSIFVGMAIYGLSYSTYSAALERIPLGIATVLMFLSPVWVALLSTFVFGEKLTGSKLLAIGICLFGAVLVSDFIGASAGAMDGLGIFFALLNGIGLALQVVIPKFLKQWYSNEATLTYGFFGAAILFAFFTDFSIFPATLAGGASLSILFYILGIGLLCTLVANVSYVKAANYISPTATSVLSSLEVVIACIAGILLFSEFMTPLQWVGAFIITFGAIGSQILPEKRPVSLKKNTN